MSEKGQKQDINQSELAKDERKIVKIANLPNEPAFQLKVEPQEVRFKYIVPNPAFSELRITNESKKRYCIKIKSTDNKIFLIQPSIVFIEPGQVIFIKFTLNDTATALPENTHYIGLFHVETTAKTHTEAFQSKPDGILRLAITYERDGGAEEQPSKPIDLK